MGRLLIFDVDGTLIDSERTIVRCLRSSSEKFGYVLGDILENVGVMKLPQILKKNGVNEVDIPSIMDGYNECFLRSVKEDTFPKKGSREVLKKLQKTDDIGILTLKYREQTRKVAEEFFPDVDFKYMICGDDDIPDKKTGLTLIADRSGKKKDEIFYIGDRASDVESALQSGIEAVWVSFGLGKKEELDKEKEFWIARKFEDLLNIFNSQT